MIVAHPNATIAILCWLLTAVINGLLRYGHAPGVVGVLGKVLDILSPFTRRDADGTFKLLFTKSALRDVASEVLLNNVRLPRGGSGSQGRVRVGLLLAIAGSAIAAVFLYASCTPAQTTSWKQFATISATKCGTPAAVGAIKEGMDALEKLAADQPVNAKIIGQKLLAQYGVETALCIVATAFDTWGGKDLDAGEVHAAPARKLLVVHWLHHHEEWFAERP